MSDKYIKCRCPICGKIIHFEISDDAIGSSRIKCRVCKNKIKWKFDHGKITYEVVE